MNSNKTIIVTGHEGFIGCWLALQLVKNGHYVIGIDNRSSLGDRLSDQIELNKKLKASYNFDICEIEKLKDVILNHQPDIIINLAGQAIVPRAHREPFSTFQTNTLGTLSVLEAARQTNTLKSVICITSDKVYKNNEQIWPYRENDTLGGKDIYSVSKACAELVCSAYVQSHLAQTNINIQTVRLGNVVGGGDWSINRLIPDLMHSVKNGTQKQFYIRYPQATRPFQHVLDVVDGILKISFASLAREIPSGEGWNLGPKNNTVGIVKDVVELCLKNWPSLSIQQDPNTYKEDINLSVEIAKYKNRFGAPKMTSHEAINLTVDWYKNFFNQASWELLIDQEFKKYENMSCSH